MLWRWMVLLCWLLPGLAMGQDYPAPQSDTVSDFANILPADVEAALSKRLQAARTDTGVHVVVVTLTSRGSIGFGDTALEPFATGLFNAWGIGDAKRNDGIMILVLQDDREMRIELGTGFPWRFDGVAQAVIDRDFLPAFRKGRYDDGIVAGTEAAIAQIAMPFAGKAAVPLLSPKPEAWDPELIIFAVIAGGIALGGSVIWAVARLIQSLRRCTACGQRGLERRSVTLIHATEHSEGREEITQHCPSCGHTETYTRSISRIRRSDRSSGGGFGGGRSSGGGASGRW